MLEEKKKTIIIAGSVVLLLLISLLLVVFSPKTYVVEFNDGVKTYSIAVKKNEKIYKPSVPTREGYTFLGWYKDGSIYDFSSKVKEDFVLVAKFQKEGEEVEIPEETTITTTTTTIESSTTTTKNTSTTKKTTKKTTKAPVATAAPTTAAPTTTRPTTTVPPTTTTKAVTYSVARVDVANSTIGQQMIYVRNNSTGSYVSGTVTITYTAGNSATVSIPAGGLMVVKSTIVSVTNPKGN